MKRHGPLITLLTGLVLALVLTGLGMNAKAKDTARQNAANTSTPTATPSATVPVTTPSASPTKAPPVEATWAGQTDDRTATIAIAAKDGKAIAYLCDGKRIEAWLQGTAIDGRLSLQGARGASLTGTFGNGVASGTISTGGRQWTFKVGVVTPPSGLYRATANVRNAKVVAGWIVVNGVTTGGMSRNGVSEPAPGLDLPSGTSSVDDTPLTAVAVTGTTSLTD